jgi:hypothetical protein
METTIIITGVPGKVFATTEKCISSFFSTGIEAKIVFKRKNTQWIIEESMSFEVGSSTLFCFMIHFLT